MAEYDFVNHPGHYNQEGRMECIDEMITFFGLRDTEVFCRLSAYKYLYRAGTKPGEDQQKDLAKARWYIEREIERIEKKERVVNE